MCTKFEMNSTELSEQKGAENISADALEKFDSIMGEISDNAPIHIKELDLFDAKAAID